MPSTRIFPKISTSEEITIVPLALEMSESSKTFPAPTIGILFVVKPAIEILEPTSTFAVVVSPVTFITFDTVFPVFTTCSSVWSCVRRFEGSIFFKSLFVLLTYT